MSVTGMPTRAWVREPIFAQGACLIHDDDVGDAAGDEKVSCKRRGERQHGAGRFVTGGRQKKHDGRHVG